KHQQRVGEVLARRAEVEFDRPPARTLIPLDLVQPLPPGLRARLLRVGDFVRGFEGALPGGVETLQAAVSGEHGRAEVGAGLRVAAPPAEMVVRVAEAPLPV